MSEVHLLIRQSGFRPKQIILVTTLLDLNAILKQNSAALSSALASDGSQFQAPQNHVKHGDDLGKITADGTKGNLDASTGLHLLRNLMWTSAELAQVPPMRISCKALGNC